MCSVPQATAASSQARLPRALAGLGVYSAADIAPWAYISSVVESANIRADGRTHSPRDSDIFENIAFMIDVLQPSLAAPAEAVIPPRDPHLLAELPA